jgi:hypothetical protein
MFLPNVPGTTFIPGATSIPESRVLEWPLMEVDSQKTAKEIKEFVNTMVRPLTVSKVISFPQHEQTLVSML